jgi:predicted GNAT family acetyltransferase
MESPTKETYKEILWKLMQEEENRQWYHWVARKQGQVVSAVSTMIQDGVVSFWNGASSPELRKQGLSTALRRFSLQHAKTKGACYGSSYLMSEGLAFGICSKLGYTTKWRFHAFISPKRDNL